VGIREIRIQKIPNGEGIAKGPKKGCATRCISVGGARVEKGNRIKHKPKSGGRERQGKPFHSKFGNHSISGLRRFVLEANKGRGSLKHTFRIRPSRKGGRVTHGYASFRNEEDKLGGTDHEKQDLMNGKTRWQKQVEKKERRGRNKKERKGKGREKTFGTVRTKEIVRGLRGGEWDSP